MNVDDIVQARVAAARAKAQQQKQERAEFAGRRKAGLSARHRAKAKRMGIRLGFCGTCARPLMRNTYLHCSQGCGAKLCRGTKRCIAQHAKQCDKRATAYTDSPGSAS
ncbi:hypothetical protein [Streptomyces sp. NPDC056543]|uniref:hypothetical protein n=1 Tax=unclassified Streptomyces TaxID=2593676 RepID=UPI0036CB9BB9